MAAPWPLATRSGQAAPGCWSPCSMPCRPGAASGASPRCASAAGRPPRSPSRWREALNAINQKIHPPPLDRRPGLVIMLVARSCALPKTYDEEKPIMTINKALLAIAMGLALAACTNQEQAADSAAEAADAATEAQQAADNAAMTGDMAAADAAQASAGAAAAAADAAADAGSMGDADDAADAAENAADAAEQAQDAAEEAAASADAPTNNDGE